MNLIYLDNAATTQVDCMVMQEAVKAMIDVYGNPSSLHDAGRSAAKLVDDARTRIARCIGAYPDEIVFTSGGSEADNLALRGITPILKQEGKTTIITSMIEHHAVLNTCSELENYGMNVIYMPVDQDGRVDIEELDKVMQENKDTLGLVSIMAVNNEIGSIQLISDIGDLCQEYDVALMTDAVQALGHINLNVQENHISLMAMSGHKIHAPKGIGVLYVRRGVSLSPMIVGGGQERRLRAGTENVPGIVAMALAMELATQREQEVWNTDVYIRKTFFKELDSLGITYSVNGDGGVPNIISLTLPGCESEALLLLLNERGICVSAGSACTAGSLEPSHVLLALGLTEQDASCTIRISMGDKTTSRDMIAAAQAIASSVEQLQAMMQ